MLSFVKPSVFHKTASEARKLKKIEFRNFYLGEELEKHVSNVIFNSESKSFISFVLLPQKLSFTHWKHENSKKHVFFIGMQEYCRFKTFDVEFDFFYLC